MEDEDPQDFWQGTYSHESHNPFFSKLRAVGIPVTLALLSLVYFYPRSESGNPRGQETRHIENTNDYFNPGYSLTNLPFNLDTTHHYYSSNLSNIISWSEK